MKVIIVGAGIGGLCGAVALERKGADVVVYEQASELREVGAGISLWANAIDALDQLGLAERIRRHAAALSGSTLLRSSGVVLLENSLESLQGRGGIALVALQRAQFIDMLREPVRGPVHLGHRCVEFEDRGQRVRVRFENGVVDEGDALIGADGIHSAVGRQLHPRQQDRYAGYVAWRAITKFPGTGSVVSETWGCGRRFGIVPLADGIVYWFATENAPPGRAVPPKQRVAELFRGWHAPIPALIEATDGDAILTNDVFDREPSNPWGRGRVSLLGDAAHPMTPNLGQGGCQAIEDALVLARALSGETDVAAGLRAYEHARMRRTRNIVLRSRRIGAMAQIESAWGCRVRDFVIRHMPARWSAKQISSVVGYREHLN